MDLKCLPLFFLTCISTTVPPLVGHLYGSTHVIVLSHFIFLIHPFLSVICNVILVFVYFVVFPLNLSFPLPLPMQDSSCGLLAPQANLNGHPGTRWAGDHDRGKRCFHGNVKQALLTFIWHAAAGYGSNPRTPPEVAGRDARGHAESAARAEGQHARWLVETTGSELPCWPLAVIVSNHLVGGLGWDVVKGRCFLSGGRGRASPD